MAIILIAITIRTTIYLIATHGTITSPTATRVTAPSPRTIRVTATSPTTIRVTATSLTTPHVTATSPKEDPANASTADQTCDVKKTVSYTWKMESTKTGSQTKGYGRIEQSF